VLGQIPPMGINSVFPESLVNGRIDKDTILDGDRHTDVKKGAAADRAGMGDDENVLYAGTNGKVEKTEIAVNQAPGTGALHGISFCQAVGGNFFVVDCDGIGAATYQEAEKIAHEDIELIEYHGCGSADPRLKGEKKEYGNLRAKAHFVAQKRLKDGRASIPDDPVLIEELLEIKFFEKKGLVWIEDKEDIKERLGRSPNRADAWVMFQYGCEISEPVKRPKDGWGRSSEFFGDNDVLSDPHSKSYMVA